MSNIQSEPTIVNDSNNFEWNDEVTIIKEQSAIAVYLNPSKDIVIRSCGMYLDECFIIIQARDIDTLCNALQNAKQTALDAR